MPPNPLSIESGKLDPLKQLMSSLPFTQMQTLSLTVCS